MSRKRSKLLVRLGIVLLIVGVVLLTVAFVRGAPPPRVPSAAGGAIPVFASANSTKNGTANGTAQPCTAQANDACYNTTLALSENLARFIGYANGVLNTLIYAMIGLSAFVVFTILLLVRWVKEKVRMVTERKVGPDDPRNYELFIPMLAHALPDSDRKAFEERARAEALADVKRRTEEAKKEKKDG